MLTTGKYSVFLRFENAVPHLTWFLKNDSVPYYLLNSKRTPTTSPLLHGKP